MIPYEIKQTINRAFKCQGILKISGCMTIRGKVIRYNRKCQGSDKTEITNFHDFN